MNFKKTLAATVISTVFLIGCNNDDIVTQSTQIKFAQFNAALAVDNDPNENYQQWVKFMSISVAEQDRLVKDLKDGTITETQEKKLAERVVQIRNIAAIIQKNRPDVLLLNEFNNNGTADDMLAINGFMKNYLAVGQSLNSIDGGDVQQPITYPYVENYATNTGLATKSEHYPELDFDLDNNGKTGEGNDAQGFGFYHGHYGFALFSKYKIDTENTRTFQNFKRKDFPNAVIPTINENCNNPEKPLPNNMKCGDDWFTGQEWDALLLSSKNHVDAPIMIPTPTGDKVINVLIAHPTPSGFDTYTHNNRYRNSQENEFWHYYINGESSLYDDNGQKGGFTGQSFVIMGDLNADNSVGTQIEEPYNGIIKLLTNEKVNQSVAQISGKFIPQSKGGAESKNPANNWNPIHPYPEVRTSVFGSRADYVLPSANLTVTDSGIYWPAEGEQGRLLMNDPRIGLYGDSKEISSDHRFVWSTVTL